MTHRLASHPHGRRPPGPLALLLAGGIGLAVLSGFGIFPMIHAAGCLSADQEVTESFRHLLMQSQQIMAAALILAPAAVWCIRSRVPAWWTRFNRCPPKSFAAALGAAVLAGTLWVQWRLFDNLPHVADAIAHLFQARIFALGRLSVPVPPCPEFFFQPQTIMTQSGQWFSRYPPGLALMLTAGLKTGLHWAVVPACSVAVCWLLLTIATRLFGRSTARIAGLLLLASPLALLLGASFMSHVPSLAMSLLALWLWLRLSDPGRPPASLLATGSLLGLAVGGAILIRPQDVPALGAMMALAWWLAAPPRRTWRMFFPAAVLGLLPCLALLAAWNAALYGSPWGIGYGFGQTNLLYQPYQGTIGFSAQFTPHQALHTWIRTALRFNLAATGWPLILILPFWAWHPRKTRGDLFCLLAAVTAVAPYFFFDYHAREYEARYCIGALPFVLLLAARSLAGLSALLRRRWPREAAGPVLAALLLALYGYAAFFYWPRYLVPRYQARYEGVSPDIHRAAQAAGLTNALVTADRSRVQYSTLFVFNDPLLQAEVIYARDRPGDADCLSHAFPERTRYVAIPGADGEIAGFAPWPGPSAARFLNSEPATD